MSASNPLLKGAAAGLLGALTLVVLCGTGSAPAQQPAKAVFGALPLPTDGPARALGFYAKGCLAGAQALPVDGPAWQVMRLSRDRNWGTPALINYIETLGGTAAAKDGWTGLLVGDMSQPRGGPMASGHASHQIGLDVDIWLRPMPKRHLSAQERESMAATPVVEPGPHIVDPKAWTDAHFRLLRRAASDPQVERIFVAPGIKKELCESESGDRSWLAKMRPYWGHNDHFHVRLKCPAGAADCRSQDPPPQGDGCGKELDYWYTDAPYRKAPPSNQPPPRPVTLADLPAACTAVVNAASRPGALTSEDQFRSKE